MYELNHCDSELLSACYKSGLSWHFHLVFVVDKVALQQVLLPVAEQSKVRVCGCSLAGIAGSNPAGGMDVCLL